MMHLAFLYDVLHANCGKLATQRHTNTPYINKIVYNNTIFYWTVFNVKISIYYVYKTAISDLDHEYLRAT